MFNKNDHFDPDFKASIVPLIIEKAEKIPDPKNFFQGLPPTEVILPENIIVFYRRKSIVTNSPSLHHRFVLICNLGTDGSVIIDSKLFRLKVGEAILIYPHQFHLYADIANEKISWVFITFEVENQGVLSNKENLVFSLSDYAMLTLSLLIESYLSSTKNERILVALIISELQMALQSKITDKVNATLEPFSGSQQLMQKIIEYIYQNLNIQIQIEDVAKHVHISASHLRRLFKKSLRIGLGAYIRQARIHRSSFLIRSTQMTFSQIASKCGFSSLYSFSRTFMQEVKMSPSAYKKRYLVNNRRKSNE
jgi:AraC-like DNA-binding protein